MDGNAIASTALAMQALQAMRSTVKIGVRMKATDVTGPCSAVQYGLIMLTSGSGKMEFWHDGKPIGWNAKLRTVRFGYQKTKTEPSDGFLFSADV